MLVVMGILSILMAMIFPNLTTIIHSSNITSKMNVLVNDMKQQQNKAMSGVLGEATGDKFGVHFDINKYTLFSGTYNVNNSLNYSVDIDSPLQIVNPSTSLPNGEIIFSNGSGEVANFDNSKKTISILNTATNTQYTIVFNKYGVVISAK